MSKINFLRNAIGLVSNGITLARTIKQSAMSQIFCYRKKIIFQEEILFQCQNINFFAKINPIQRKEIAIFSDRGFCGNFNKWDGNKNIEFWGRKAKGKPLNTIINYCKKNWSYMWLDVWVNDKGWKKISMDTFCLVQESNFLCEWDENFFPLWQKYFLLYCLGLTYLNENLLRNDFMKNAEENSLKIKKDLTNQWQKQRKEEIDKDIGLRVHFN